MAFHVRRWPSWRRLWDLRWRHAPRRSPWRFASMRSNRRPPARKHCDHPVSADVISAEGAITNDTADDFLAFSATARPRPGPSSRRADPLPRRGTVVGAMKLGMMFRKIGAAVIVARAVGEQGSDRAHVVPGACMSACVYAFFGGKRRVIPPVSRLGIHRMAIYAHSHDPAGGEQVTRTYGTDDLVTALSDYTKQMGVDPRGDRRGRADRARVHPYRDGARNLALAAGFAAALRRLVRRSALPRCRVGARPSI